MKFQTEEWQFDKISYHDLKEKAKSETDPDKLLVWDMFDILTAHQRDIVEMKAIANLTFGQIAELLNQHRGSVQNQYYKAMAILRGEKPPAVGSKTHIELRLLAERRTKKRILLVKWKLFGIPPTPKRLLIMPRSGAGRIAVSTAIRRLQLINKLTKEELNA